MNSILFSVFLSLGIGFVLLGVIKLFICLLKCQCGYVFPKKYEQLVVLPFIIWVVILTVPPLMVFFSC